ncbi:MAG: hypothetical protein U5R31_01140 [Acidimicrobiia bacterium]|nr:hypothetical protein [Acidimicrobiia bacterium]
MVEYDEFGLLHENAAEVGLPWDGPPSVRREHVEAHASGSTGSMRDRLGPPAARARRCTAANAQRHTWDTVALALDRPLLAVDLPGHGHSDCADDRHRLSPRQQMAEDVAATVERFATAAVPFVGMSLGGSPPAAHRGTPRHRPPDLVGHHAGGRPRKGAGHHRLRGRTRGVRQLRRDPRTDHRVQSHPEPVVRHSGERRRYSHNARRRR